MTNDAKKGYIALISILIISFVLFSAVITSNFEGFWSLSGTLNRESKEISFNLARSCLDQAVVRVIQRPSWRPDEDGDILEIGEYECVILSIARNNNLLTIETRAQDLRAVTSLRAVFES